MIEHKLRQVGSAVKRVGRHVLGFLLLSSVALAEALWLPSVFSDHMVLQRGQTVPVWGKADPGAQVTVTFGGQSESTVADQSGRWHVNLAPLTASGEARVLEVNAPSERREFSDVLVGEVWLCSGQSNMDMPLQGSKRNPVDDSAAEIAQADHPLIRLYRTPKVLASAPRETIDATWEVCSPATVGKFSAVAYFFGRKLQKDLDVPVGLLQTAWGGTSIDPWTAPIGYEGIASLAGLQHIADHMPPLEEERDPEARKQLKQTPTALFNGMIHAHVPFAIRGVIWYQGEHDHLDAALYVEKTRALLNGWRKLWGYEFPFYYVQIAPFTYKEEDPSKLPQFWEAQAAIAQAISFTAMAVISDAATPNNIHPPNKKIPGIRLALLAEAHTYGLDVVCSGPVLRSVESKGDVLQVWFDHGEGLSTRDGKSPDWFEIAGEDGVYQPADATIQGDSVILSLSQVPKPRSVRFAWNKVAIPNLINGAGLPASAFRAGERKE